MVHGRFMQDLEYHHICRQEVPQYKPRRVQVEQNRSHEKKCSFPCAREAAGNQSVEISHAEYAGRMIGPIPLR